MAVTSLPGVGFTLTIPNTTTLVPVDDVTFGADAVAPYDNTKSIVIYNTDATNRIFVRFDLTAAANISRMVAASCTIIPALSSMTFSVGTIGDRPQLGIIEATNLYFAAEAGTNVAVNVTYLQGMGGPIA